VRPPFLRWLERLLFLTALLCLGTWAWVTLDARLYEHRQERRLAERPHRATSAEAPAQPAPPLAEGDYIGRISIPRVGISASILQGVAAQTLRRGVGHIPGTPLPERGGNIGLAGHRDTVFRGLKDIRQNDTIELTTEEGSFAYQVEWTKIVLPKDTWVLAGEGKQSLTLVTCYPFYYVGSAPKRFIVRARRIEKAG